METTPLCDIIKEKDSDIVNFFKDANVFITGATGFLGKVLLEKLLRTCYDVNKIYITLRPKKGKNVNERLKALFEPVIFDSLKENHPNFLDKIVVLHADLLEKNLGLSIHDEEKLLSEVNIILHCAATTRFDEHIRKATLINVSSVNDLLRIAEKMKKLKAFVHVSTAFSNCTKPHIEEIIYKSDIEAEQLFKLIECFDDEVLEKMTPILLKDYPNTYTFTKQIAENLVAKTSNVLPIAILRPSIVVSSLAEPLPGWLDTMFGPVTFSIGISLGIVRVMTLNKDYPFNLVPLDYVANSIIALAWNIGTNNSINLELNNKIPICNHVNSVENPITYGEYVNKGFKHFSKYQSPLILWPAMLVKAKNMTEYKFFSFFLHTIPALIIDTGLYFLGKPQVAQQTYKKIDKFVETYSYFLLNKWSFNNNNTQHLWHQLNMTDKKLFPFSMKNVNYDEYCDVVGLGSRIYLLKDPIETLQWGRRKSYLLRMANYTLLSVLAYLLYKLLMFIIYFFVTLF